MASRPEIDGAWPALSRVSNLRCAWCHTAQAGIRAADDMPFELPQEIVGLASDLGVGNVTLTRGEPTLYPHILDAIRHCKEMGLRVSLPTNGLACASGDGVERFIGAGVDRVGVSPKAHDRQGHVDATGIDCSEDVVCALSVLSRRDDVGLVTPMAVTAHNWCLQDPSFMARLGRHHQPAYSR